jgi:hypothetical protein
VDLVLQYVHEDTCCPVQTLPPKTIWHNSWDQSQLDYFHLAEAERRRYHRHSSNTTELHATWRTFAMESSMKFFCSRQWSLQQFPNVRGCQYVWNNVDGLESR